MASFKQKRPGELPTNEQAEFLAMVRDAGGAAGVANNWQQAKAILSEGE